MTIAAPPLPSLIDPQVFADPHAFYARLRDEAPVHWDEGVQAFLVASYDGVSTLYRDPRFSTRGYQTTSDVVHGRTVLSMEGREHAKNRAMLTPHFRGRGLEGLMDKIHGSAARILAEIVPLRAAALAEDLAAAADDRGQVDLVTRFSHRYPVAVIADMLGLPEHDHDMFIHWYMELMLVVSNFAGDPAIHQRGLDARDQLRDYLMPMIAARRTDPGDDLISAIVLSEVDGYSMSDDEVRAYSSLLLTAGGETTDKGFSSLCRNLLVNDLWGTVRDDRSLVVPAIAETLRFSPPSQITTRMTDEDVELDGVHIPADSTVFPIAASANRDSTRFERASEFLLPRADLKSEHAFTAAADHLAFGMGRHFCLGAMLAKTEMEVGLNLLLDTFPDLRLVDAAPVRDVGLRTRGPESLLVALG